MKVIKLVLLGALSLNLFAYETLEDLGETFEIKDPDMMVEMKKAYDKIDKESLKKKIIASVREQLKGKLDLPSCKISQTRVVKKQNNFKDFNFKELGVEIKPNTTFNNYNLKETLAILNVDKQKDINWYLKSYIKKGLGYKILIAKGDLETKKIDLRYKERFILDKNLAKLAQVKCTPTIITFKGDEYILEEIKLGGEGNES